MPARTVKNGVPDLEITLKLRCTHRPGQRKSYSFFKFQDCSCTVTDIKDDGTKKEIGNIFGCIGGFLELAAEKDSGLMWEGEYWVLSPDDLWYAFQKARENLGTLPLMPEEEEEEEIETKEKQHPPKDGSFSFPTVLIMQEPKHQEEPGEEPPKKEFYEVDEVIPWEPEPIQVVPYEVEQGVLNAYTDKVVYLEITTWVGSSAIWAKHYYGKLSCGSWKTPKASVEKVVDSAIANRLTLDEQESGWKDGLIPKKWQAGESSSRFWTENEVIEAAKAMWRKVFPQAVLLIKGNSISDPQPAIDGNPGLVEQCNLLHEKYENTFMGKEKQEKRDLWEYWWKTSIQGER